MAAEVVVENGGHSEGFDTEDESDAASTASAQPDATPASQQSDSLACRSHSLGSYNSEPLGFSQDLKGFSQLSASSQVPNPIGQAIHDAEVRRDLATAVEEEEDDEEGTEEAERAAAAVQAAAAEADYAAGEAEADPTVDELSDEAGYSQHDWDSFAAQMDALEAKAMAPAVVDADAGVEPATKRARHAGGPEQAAEHGEAQGASQGASQCSFRVRDGAGEGAEEGEGEEESSVDELSQETGYSQHEWDSIAAQMDALEAKAADDSKKKKEV